ncbi:MAG TPA: RNA polymerase sigma factor FliA [Nitrococcus sp.]|nr:RNA polymerase sigma factor FliA [Nitrococcus sp.]
MKNLAAYGDVQRVQIDDDVLVRHAPLVKRIAHHLAGRLPPSVLIDDLVQAGMIGLLEAARQYDAAQGASFQTYAAIRIRGAMLDEVRRLDWTPRSVHRKAREVASAVAAVERQTGREAKDWEVAQHLGLDLHAYHHVLQDAATARIFSIDEQDSETGEPHEPSGYEPAVTDILEQEGFQAALADAIRELPEREQLVMQLYYDEELNLKEIGQVLGVSESRVSQIHGRIALKLRTLLADWM